MLGQLIAHGLAGATLLGSSLFGFAGSSDSSGPTAAQFRDMGHTWAPSKQLRSGCQTYRYRYNISPTSPDWSLEVFFVDPRGRRIASDVLLSGADPVRDASVFRMCRSSTTPGRFRISARLKLSDYPDTYQGWIKPSYFTMTR